MPTSTPPKVKFDLNKIEAMPLPEGVTPTAAPSRAWGPKKGVFTFYTLTTAEQPKGLGAPPDKPSYYIRKFNSDIDMESSYIMNWIPSQGGGYYDCTCPGAAKRFDCRHKSIMREIVQAGKQDTGEFFCFETRTFKSLEQLAHRRSHDE